MLKRLIAELTEPLCECTPGTPMALDMETSKADGSFEFQIACTGCKTYISMPLANLRALVKMADEEEVKPPPPVKRQKPKLILIQGGASSNPATPPTEEAS